VWLVPVGIVLVAAALRFPGLADKPLHSDEGVNGWFTLRLHWWNLYRYRPSDYHGPFLYYVNLLFVRLLGPGEVALRAGTALAGALLPLALLPLRRHLGLAGILCAGLLCACSPTMVYFARTNIHETYLLLGTLLWLAGIVRYSAAPAMRWSLLCSSGAALSFVNKETALITAASLAAGLGLAWLLGRVQPGGLSLDDPDLFAGVSRRAALRSWFRGRWRLLAAGGGLFAVILVVCFSSFLSWFPGVLGFFEAFVHWVDYGLKGRNQSKDWTYFLDQLLEVDGLLVVVASMAAGLWALWTRHRFGLLLVGWLASSAAAYSLLPYKTPWCGLNVELPMLVLTGWGVGQLWLSARDCVLSPAVRMPALAAVLCLLLASVPLYRESAHVNRNGFDDDAHSYVFVQTERAYYEFLQDLFGVGDRLFALEGRRPRVVNVDPKNPTRWYTITRGWDYDSRDYLNGKLPEPKRLEKAEVVLATGPRARQVARLLADTPGQPWQSQTYDLRPGVRVWAWFRADHWAAYQSAGGRSISVWPRPPSELIYTPPIPRKYRKSPQ
jgi:uncharacterized protein (TIGR03663 family)